MKFNVLLLPTLLVSLCLPAAAAGPAGFIQVSDQRRSELRDAVEAHRAANREEVRREEAAAGRRLTPAELAQLRQQVRQQWLPRQELIHSAESLPAERMMPSPSLAGTSLAAPRTQRP